MKIVYVGELVEGETCLQRLEALRALGHAVIGIPTWSRCSPRAPGMLLSRVFWKAFRAGLPVPGPLDLTGANRQILAAVKEQTADVLWIDKGLTIAPRTLAWVKERQPACVIAGYSPDDMTRRHNQSRRFLAQLPLYDIFFTTKSYGVPELRALGCPRVEFIGNAFHPDLHRPVPVGPQERERLGGEVGFIGVWERERGESIRFLARAGISVTVWGNGWQQQLGNEPNVIVRGPSRFGEDYVRIICATDINLGFLRKLNRDRQTTRSIEIPACGAFLLAERTDEHLALFTEGKEAAFFSSDQELLDKVRYYLLHAEERKQIAAAGRERCLHAGYSNQHRLAEMMQKVELLGSGLRSRGA